jgi:hypothetical protein
MAAYSSFYVYSRYNCSASGMFSRYHCCQFPAFSPPPQQQQR